MDYVYHGGGVKGAAHIGVLKAFEEQRIEFDYISGTSSGSIVASLYAIGYSADEIYNIFKKYCRQIKLFDLGNILKSILDIFIKNKFTMDGLNSGKKLEKIMEKTCKEKNIENISEVKKCLLIPSVDLNNGEIYIFSSCNNDKRNYSDKIIYINNIEIWKAVRASCGYPGVFSPYKYKSTELIDGGIRENIPWKELKKIGVDKVISVVFSKDKKIKNEKNIIDVIDNSLDILCHELSAYELEGADYLIDINTIDVSLLDFKKIDYLYELGYKCGKKYIQEKLIRNLSLIHI